MALDGDRAETPLVSVIVPHFNDARRLQVCLGALHRQSYPACRFEVLVVDNGSDRAPIGVVRACPNAQLLSETTVGSYAARNAGVRHARGEILAFTDSDCQPDPRWLEEGVRALRADPACSAVGGSIEVFAADPKAPTAVEVYERLTAFRQESSLSRFGYFATANLFVPQAVFARVGAFDSRLASGGDLNWCRRARARGLRLVHAPEARVRHPARASLRALVRKRRRVIGGNRDAWRLATPLASGVECAKVLMGMLPPVRQLARAVTDRQLQGPRERCLFAAVAALHHYVEPCERLRLLLGGQVDR